MLLSKDSISLFSHIQDILYTISLVWHLKNLYSCFSSYFCILDLLLFVIKLFLKILLLLAVLIRISLLFFHIFIESLNFIHTILNTSVSSSSLSSCHIKRHCTSSAIYLFCDLYFLISLLSILRRVQSILLEMQYSYFFIWLDFSCIV